MIKSEILSSVRKLLELYKRGKLGGEKMPEDENPALSSDSEQNLLYFTLPMALNYQRNSYKLWEGANKTFQDADTSFVFNPDIVVKSNDEVLRKALLKYKVALQPNKHIEIWRTISATFHNQNIKDFFATHNYDVEEIKSYILKNKKDFPYLSGPKILNYWLYVMTQYTDLNLTGREYITIAPDTHVIQASVKLGLIQQPEVTRADIRDYIADLWRDLLKDTDISPIDVHTPLWLWSRGGFKVYQNRQLGSNWRKA